MTFTLKSSSNLASFFTPNYHIFPSSDSRTSFICFCSLVSLPQPQPGQFVFWMLLDYRRAIFKLNRVKRAQILEKPNPLICVNRFYFCCRSSCRTNIIMGISRSLLTFSSQSFTTDLMFVFFLLFQSFLEYHLVKGTTASPPWQLTR